MAIAHITQDDKQLKEEFGAPFFQRDYNLLETYYPDILEQVERAIGRGKSPETIRRWAKEYLGDADNKWIVRIFNAARYVASLKAN